MHRSWRPIFRPSPTMLLCHTLTSPGRCAPSAWVRRRRGRIAAAWTILLAGSALLAGGIGLRVERANLLRQASLEADAGQDALDRGDFSAAQARFDSTADLVKRSASTPWSYLARFNDFRHLGGQLRSKFQDFKSVESPENFWAWAVAKSKLAERTGRVHQKADELFRAADHLRFRLLLDEGPELTQATVDLQEVLAPFFVLENPDWTKLTHTMPLLDANRRARLESDVNELLFLWMAAIDESAGDRPQPLKREGASPDGGEVLGPAVGLCERALVWAHPKAPWLALQARLRANQTMANGSLVRSEAGPDTQAAFDEPSNVTLVSSSLACFQWGVLAYRDDRLSRAIEWLEQAARLERGKNYWYQFLLGYLEDKAGYTEDAFRNYSIAVALVTHDPALRPASPWVLFSRARIFRAGPLGLGPRRLHCRLGRAQRQVRGYPRATRARLPLSAGGRLQSGPQKL